MPELEHTSAPSSASTSGASTSGASVSGASVSGASVSSASVSSADALGVSVSGADALGASVSGADALCASDGPRHAAHRAANPGPGPVSWMPRSALALGLALCVGIVSIAGSQASGAGRRTADTTAAKLATPQNLAGPSIVTSLEQLSQGAPAGAKVLTPNPVLVSKPAAATPAVVSGLAANGIPAVALTAYRRAAARMASAEPSCKIDWTLLAGIGRVESDHGQFGGATLLSNGTSSIPIIGPALNGVGNDYIADTDHGRLDGDTVYDRAVGPMQFIPSTWAEYGLDGDGDGVANPFDINDAALTAARYLCVAGGDLSTLAGKERAILAYNHSDQYLALVLATAAAYAAGVPVGGPIGGVTTGALPPVGNGFVPPVNPGQAIGIPSTLGGSSTPITLGSGTGKARAGSGSSGSRGHTGTGSTGTGSTSSGSTSSGSGAGSGTGSGSGTGTGSGSGTGTGTGSGSGTGTGTGSGSGTGTGTGSGSGTGTGTGSGSGSLPTSAPTGGLPITLPPLPSLPVPTTLPLPLPSATNPVAVPAPSSTSPNPVSSTVCTVLGVLGQIIKVPC